MFYKTKRNELNDKLSEENFDLFLFAKKLEISNKTSDSVGYSGKTVCTCNTYFSNKSERLLYIRYYFLFKN